MIDTVAAKRRLLQMAISGLLTQRSESDEQVQDTIVRIDQEYVQLLKGKQTKKKKVSPMISEGLFTLPDSWAWVPLGELCVFLSRGRAPKYSDEQLYPVFAQKCNQPDGLALDKALFLDKRTLEKWAPYFRLKDGDVLINSTGTGTMGRVGYYTTETLDNSYPFMLPDSHVTVARLGKGVVSKYIYYALRSVTLQTIMERQFRGTTNQKEFYIDSAYAMPIPLPPANEQEEIVSKLDAAFAQIDRIRIAQEQYEANVHVLRMKTIDAGIRGMLTEQLEEDGRASDLIEQMAAKKIEQQSLLRAKKSKVLPPVEESEIPFVIPKNWTWLRIGNAAFIVRGGSPRPIKSYITNDESGINWIKIGDVEKGGKYIYSTKEKIIPEGEKKSRRVAPGDFLLTNSMSFGRPYISMIDGCIHDGWLLIRNLGGFDIDYLYYLLSSTYMYNQFCLKASGSTVDNLNIDKVSSALIPLPPLAEQRRIADRIEELLNALPE